MGAIYLVGTCDTKGEELRFVRDTLRELGHATVLVDVSVSGGVQESDVSPMEVAAYHPAGADFVLGQRDRGDAVAAMADALIPFLTTRCELCAAFGLGGSGGTALVSPALRSLPIGLPKVLVSTVASGNVAPYVGSSDIFLIYSITDLAGLNRISRTVLSNAAFALAGMVGAEEYPHASSDRLTVGLTMFGVTTPCVQQLTEYLKVDYDTLVFHATGAGGQSFEKLVDSGLIAAGLDITTTEVCDLLVGGVFPATEDRFGAFIRTGVPYVGSCGALDMVNFGAPESVPDRFRHRRLHPHNPQVTLMRTTAEECDRIGTWIGERLNLCEGEIRFLIPEGGISAIAGPGQPFYDPEADAALFNALERTLRVTSKRRLERVPQHINSPEFASAALAAFNDAMSSHAPN